MSAADPDGSPPKNKLLRIPLGALKSLRTALDSRKGLRIAVGVTVIVVAVAVVVWLVVVVLNARHVAEEQTGRLSAPPAVAGLTKSENIQLQAVADSMNAQIKRGVQKPAGTITSFYSDPADPAKNVLVAGVMGDVKNPDKQVDDMFASVRLSGVTVSGIKTVDAGPMSGSAKCGMGQTQGVPVAVCSWADHGSVGVAMFFNRDLDGSAPLFKQIRNEILKRE
jgi:hypothetical protein